MAVVGLVERLVEYEHDYALEDARVGDGQCAELRRQLVELLRRELVEQRAHVTVRRFFIAQACRVGELVGVGGGVGEGAEWRWRGDR